MTPILTRVEMIWNQIPILEARWASGRLESTSSFFASSLISIQLFNNANRGARGNTATKHVKKPNCNTLNYFKTYQLKWFFFNLKF